MQKTQQKTELMQEKRINVLTFIEAISNRGSNAGFLKSETGIL